MASGGARNRSGPQADPKSGRSDARGYTLTALPSEGYQGEVPRFPLPGIIRWTDVWTDKIKRREADQDETELFREREVAIWNEAWTTPQACAWSLEPWRFATIGEYCRLKAVVELEPDANAALVGQLHRYRDQIGLTPAGLKDNGWAIARDEVAAKAASKSTAKTASSRDRMQVVRSNGK